MTASNGWTLYMYPLLDEDLRSRRDKLQKAAESGTGGDRSRPAAKLLAVVQRYMMEVIPADPGASKFRQGNTLGKGNRQWFRAKLFNRYRLFFRFSTKEKAIIYVWLNDEHSLRKEGSKSDPYARFEAMIGGGDPPQTFEDLLDRSRAL